MTSHPPYEMHDAYILKKEDWLRLIENLTIGCTNQKAFLDSLVPCASHSSSPAAVPVPEHFNDEDNGVFSLGESTPCEIFTVERLRHHDEQIRQEAAAKAKAEVLDLIIKEAQSAREENRKIERATIDEPGKQHWRGRAVGNKEIGEYAESLRQPRAGGRS